MRLVALLIPVGLVGGFLAVQGRQDHHHDRVVVVPDAPAATQYVIGQTGSGKARAPKAHVAATVSQGSGPSTVTIDLTDVEATIMTSIETALRSAAVGLESAELSIDATQELLDGLSEILSGIATSVDGELDIVTHDGQRLRIAADGAGSIEVSKVYN